MKYYLAIFATATTLASLPDFGLGGGLRAGSEYAALNTKLSDNAASLLSVKQRLLDANESEEQLQAVADAMLVLGDTAVSFLGAADLAQDVEALIAATDYISKNQAFMIEYGNEDTVPALTELAELSVAHSHTAQDVLVMANTLLKDSTNTKSLFELIEGGTDLLDTRSLALLEGGIQMLSNTLTTTIAQTETIRATVTDLELRANTVAVRLDGIAVYFDNAADENSVAMQRAKAKVELEGNIVCGLTCVLLFPFGCACYIDLYARRIPEIQNQFRDTTNQLRGIVSPFNEFTALATAFGEEISKQHSELGSFEANVRSTLNFVDSASDVFLAQFLSELYIENMVRTIDAAESLISAFN